VTDAPREDADLYPVFLKLEARAVLVVGAGEIAERKVVGLLGARARIRVVSPTATAAIQQLASAGKIDWQARAFDAADVSDAWLVIAATGDARAQKEVAAAAEERRCFVIAVDDPGHASAYSGAIVRRPPFTIAISSSGATPALTRLVREVIEHVLPGEDAIERAKRLRAKWRTEGKPTGERFDELVRELTKR
jgi:siroheme synthase-like protein